MTDAEPASSLISAQFQVIIGRQIRVIALTPFRCSLRHLAGDTSTLKYNMSEMGGPAGCSVGYWSVSRKGGVGELEAADRNGEDL
jgi:hypothetical protein